MRPLLLLPLDARPVCYQTPQLLAAMAGIPLYLPPLALLGSLQALKQPADAAPLLAWVHEVLAQHQAPQAIIASLDLLAYGGLIPSRVGQETLEALQQQVLAFYGALQGCRLHAFSSILRIPAYNNAEEEPDYWATQGLALYHYSVALHRCQEEGLALPAPNAHIDPLVLKDFVARRQRNHALNRWHLEAGLQGLTPPLNTLAFCQDDTGSHGLNVQEAQELAALLQQQGVPPQQGWVQTGADEVAHTLLAQVALAHTGHRPPHIPKVWVAYTAPQGGEAHAKFDGQPLQAVVAQRLAACGAQAVASVEEAHLVWLIHGPLAETEGAMGDHCEGRAPQLNAPLQHAEAQRVVQQAQRLGLPLLLADVASANGGDMALFEALFEVNKAQEPVDTWLYAYAGWNTPGNTLGSCLAMGLLRWWAEQQGSYAPAVGRHLLWLRFMDDLFYQGQVRAQLKAQHGGNIPPAPALQPVLQQAMQAAAAVLQQRTGLQAPSPHWQATWPCGRWFEVHLDS